MTMFNSRLRPGLDHSSQPSSSSTRRRRSSAARASASACLNAATASGNGGTSSPMGGGTQREMFRVDHDHLPSPAAPLRAAERHHRRGEAGAVEDVGREADHRLDEILFQQRPADAVLGALAEQRALRQHHRHAPRVRRHLLDPGVVAVAGRRQAERGAAPRVRVPDLAAPLLQGERRVGDDAVERRQGAGRIREVLLLAEDAAEERARVGAGALHVLDRAEQHAADDGSSSTPYDAVQIGRETNHAPQRSLQMSLIGFDVVAQRGVDQRLVAASAPVVRHASEPRQNVVVDADGDPGLAPRRADGSAPFPAAESYSCFMLPPRTVCVPVPRSFRSCRERSRGWTPPAAVSRQAARCRGRRRWRPATRRCGRDRGAAG